MKYGTRPNMDYSDRQPRPQRKQSFNEKSPHAILGFNPEISIIRQVRTEPGELTSRWHEYLDELGAINRRKGMTCALGSVAITYVKAAEIERMLKERYPKAYIDSRRTLNFYKSVNKEIKSYLREEHDRYSNQEHGNDTHKDTASHIGHIAIPRQHTPEDARSKPKDLFGDMTCSLKELSFYGKNRYGANLSLNEELYEERQQILDFLKNNLHFETRFARHNWEPHASIFKLHVHISPATEAARLNLPDERAFSLPPAMEFYPPRTSSIPGVE